MESQNSQPPSPGRTVAPGGDQAPAPGLPPDTGIQEPQVELGPESGNGDKVPNDGTMPADGRSDDNQAVTWTASEFIAHDKPFGWYAALGLAATAFAGAVYLISRDFISVGVVLVAAALFGFYAKHKPRQMEYRLDSNGLSVGQKRFRYGNFRSFAVVEENAISSIVFMPLKRFAMPTTIYYPPEEEDKIVGVLADRLPMEQRGHDAIDKLMHRVRY